MLDFFNQAASNENPQSLICVISVFINNLDGKRRDGDFLSAIMVFLYN